MRFFFRAKSSDLLSCVLLFTVLMFVFEFTLHHNCGLLVSLMNGWTLGVWVAQKIHGRDDDEDYWDT